MRRATSLLLTLLAVALATGCGGGGGSSSSGGSSGSAGTGGGAFEVVRCEPTQGSRPTLPNRIRLVFSHPIDPSTVFFDASGTSVSTIVFVEQPPGASTSSLKPGTITVSGNEIIYVPQTTFLVGTAYGVALSSSILDTGGAALAAGAVGGPITLFIQGIIFQAEFAPGMPMGTTGGGTGVTTGGGTGGGTTGGTTSGGATGGTTGGAGPAALVSSFAVEPGSDPWFIDFNVTGLFDDDVRAHGLATTDPTVAAWAQARIEQRVLSYTGTKYLRNADGTGVSGRSYAISFVASAPPGRVEVDYSRHCIGGDGGSTLGLSFYDQGNQYKEDNSPQNGCGIFSGGISGVSSDLSPQVTTAEVRFVDGSYRLGQGTASQDARFLAIQGALSDYGMAIGCVLAHEVGHSVGLDHDNAGSTSIMNAAVSAQQMSDPNMSFSSISRRLLDQNLGFTR